MTQKKYATVCGNLKSKYFNWEKDKIMNHMINEISVEHWDNWQSYDPQWIVIETKNEDSIHIKLLKLIICMLILLIIILVYHYLNTHLFFKHNNLIY